jgi:hypothetical protein
MNKSYSLKREDLVKLGTGLGIALAGAALTYISQVITQVDFGAYSPLVVAFWSVFANFIRKIIDGK